MYIIEISNKSPLGPILVEQSSSSQDDAQRIDIVKFASTLIDDEHALRIAARATSPIFGPFVITKPEQARRFLQEIEWFPTDVAIDIIHTCCMRNQIPFSMQKRESLIRTAKATHQNSAWSSELIVKLVNQLFTQADDQNEQSSTSTGDGSAE